MSIKYKVARILAYSQLRKKRNLSISLLSFRQKISTYLRVGNYSALVGVVAAAGVVVVVVAGAVVVVAGVVVVVVGVGVVVVVVGAVSTVGVGAATSSTTAPFCSATSGVVAPQPANRATLAPRTARVNKFFFIEQLF